MRRRSYLVAGGAGFIGSHLCAALLAEGNHVTCLDNLYTGSVDNLEQLKREPRFAFVEGDIVDLPALEGPVDGVFNLACPASPPHYQADPVKTLLASVVGTHALLSLAAGQGARFLLASTSEVYGDPEVHPQTEAYRGNVSSVGPRACYDEGKRAAETLCSDFRRRREVDGRIARIFNTYGPNMRHDDGRVVSNIVCQALQGSDITVYGDGSQTRSFCYVSDMVEGLLRLMALDAADGLPVNLGNPSEITVRELVDEVVKLTGTRSRIARRPLPADDPRRRRPDISRAAALLGWRPQIELSRGLPETIAWFSGAGRPQRHERNNGRRLERNGSSPELLIVSRSPKPSKRSTRAKAAGAHAQGHD